MVIKSPAGVRPRTMAKTPWRRVLRYSGIASLALGILATLWVLFLILLNQILCNEGNSPIPPPGQSCGGYIPQVVLFEGSSYPTLLFGLYLIYLGAAILVLGWWFQRNQTY
jgi:hypothetical protein